VLTICTTRLTLKILRSFPPQSVFMCLYGSQNKQLLFPCTPTGRLWWRVPWCCSEHHLFYFPIAFCQRIESDQKHFTYPLTCHAVKSCSLRGKICESPFHMPVKLWDSCHVALLTGLSPIWDSFSSHTVWAVYSRATSDGTGCEQIVNI